MATLLNYREQIVLDAEISNNPDFPPTRILRIINLAQRYVQSQLNGLGMKKWESEQVVTAGLTAGAFLSGTNNVKTIAIGTTYFPNMLESPNSIMFIQVNDGSNYGIAYPVDAKRLAQQVQNSLLTPSVKEAVFARLANKVLLLPSGITAATAYYYKAITDLAQDADVSEIPLEFEEFVIRKAVADIEDASGRTANKQEKLNQIEKDMAMVYQKFHGKQMEEDRISNNRKSKLQ